jgi:hypothetical protein
LKAGIFKETLKTLQENAFAQSPDFRIVLDAAGYNAETIQSLTGIKQDQKSLSR